MWLQPLSQKKLTFYLTAVSYKQSMTSSNVYRMQPCSQDLQERHKVTAEKQNSDLGYDSMPSEESEIFETNYDAVNGTGEVSILYDIRLSDICMTPDYIKPNHLLQCIFQRNIMVQYKDSPYYMQVENQSGNARGRIIVVEEVEDPGNVNGTHSCITAMSAYLYSMQSRTCCNFRHTCLS